MAMMSSKGSEALSKFLETPELVEMLLPFLNAENTLAFAQYGVINIKILQGRPLIDWVIQAAEYSGIFDEARRNYRHRDYHRRHHRRCRCVRHSRRTIPPPPPSLD